MECSRYYQELLWVLSRWCAVLGIRDVTGSIITTTPMASTGGRYYLSMRTGRAARPRAEGGCRVYAPLAVLADKVRSAAGIKTGAY